MYYYITFILLQLPIVFKETTNTTEGKHVDKN